MTKLDPQKCFPLIVDRQEYDGGIMKLMRIFSGGFADGSSAGDVNICAGPGGPIAVKTTDIYRPYLQRCLREQEWPDHESNEEMTRAETWHGIVDGIYSWRAIIRLQKTEPDIWLSFRWSVQVLSTTPTIERLFQMKRSYEENRKSENLIFVTLYDEYERILREYKSLKKVNNKEPSAPLIAKAYDGAEHTSADTVTQKVRTALHLGCLLYTSDAADD